MGLRPGRRLATPDQHRYIHVLAIRADVEVPDVVSFEEADDAIERLKERIEQLRQPTLEGME